MPPPLVGMSRSLRDLLEDVALGTPARGDLSFFGPSAKLTNLPAGPSGFVLQANGVGADPSWVVPPAAPDLSPYALKTYADAGDALQVPRLGGVTITGPLTFDQGVGGAGGGATALVFADTPPVSSTASLVRYGATTTGLNAAGTYQLLNAPTGWTGDFFRGKVGDTDRAWLSAAGGAYLAHKLALGYPGSANARLHVKHSEALGFNVFQIDPDEAGVGTTVPSFYHCLSGNLFSGTRKDQVMLWGWNIGSGGSAVIAGEPAIAFSMESHYESSPGYSQQEVHLLSVNAAGVQRRPFSYLFFPDSTITSMQDVTHHEWFTADHSVQYAGVNEYGFHVYGLDTAFYHGANNRGIVFSRTWAGDIQEIVRVAASDRIRLGGLGTPIIQMEGKLAVGEGVNDFTLPDAQLAVQNIVANRPAILAMQHSTQSVAPIQLLASDAATVLWRVTTNGKMIGSAIQLTDGATNGYFLKSDASGNAIWAAVDLSSYATTSYVDTADALRVLKSGSIADIATRTHSLLTSLSADDHPQYALLAGRAGGQTLSGGTAASGNLTLQSTAHATRGKILFGTSAYDEASNQLCLGGTTAGARLEVDGAASAITAIFKASGTTPGDTSQWQNSSNVVLANVDSTGNFYTKAGQGSDGSLRVGSASGGLMIPYLGARSESASYGIHIQTSRAANQSALTGYGVGGFFLEQAFTGTSGTLISIYNNAEFRFSIANRGGTVIRNDSVNTGDLLQLQKGDGTVLARFDATGQLGIGGTPSYKLDVTGDINASAYYRLGGSRILTDISSVLYFGNFDASVPIRMRSQGNYVLNISSSGLNLELNTVLGWHSGVYGSSIDTTLYRAAAGQLRTDASFGIGGSPGASALLDLQSTARGLLLPRMTTTQKNAISAPAEGLEVYDLTLHKKCVFTGSVWETITSA